MKSSFKYPKVFDDLIDLYKSYSLIHSHLPKFFQGTTGSVILLELTNALKHISLINIVDDESVSYQLAIQKLQLTLNSLTVIKAMLNTGWQLKAISNGNMVKLFQQLEEVKSQVTAWQKWCDNLSN